MTFFVSAFRGKDYAIPPLAIFFCTCIAKTSVVWIPMLYLSTSTQFELHIVNQNALNQPLETNRVDATLANVPTLARKNAEMEMIPVTGNITNKQTTVTNKH